MAFSIVLTDVRYEALYSFDEDLNEIYRSIILYTVSFDTQE